VFSWYSFQIFLLASRYYSSGSNYYWYNRTFQVPHSLYLYISIIIIIIGGGGGGGGGEGGVGGGDGGGGGSSSSSSSSSSNISNIRGSNILAT